MMIINFVTTSSCGCHTQELFFQSIPSCKWHFQKPDLKLFGISLLEICLLQQKLNIFCLPFGFGNYSYSLQVIIIITQLLATMYTPQKFKQL